MLILYFIIAYLGLGVLFALLFVTRLIHKVDEATEESSWWFKMIIFPGCVVFWPVLLKKYIQAIRTKSND